MELASTEMKASVEYLKAFHRLIGDARTKVTFREIVQGIIGSESLKASRIAAISP